jgi:hypothetical protein
MSDIVQRLRATTDGATVNPDGLEAAAEIERLRAALLKIRRGSVWNCDIEAFIDAALAEEKKDDR